MKKTFDLDQIFSDLKHEALDAAQKKGADLAEEITREGLRTIIKIGDRYFNGAKKVKALPRGKK